MEELSCVAKLRKLTGTSTAESGKRNYITYRSCVPADGEEKLSVLGFEINQQRRRLFQAERTPSPDGDILPLFVIPGRRGKSLFLAFPNSLMTE
ncbi:hypothetical protein HPP92_004199 [Vanilla planifolia]|uniref:Uncharacterized protein n=1 Tax=Vanilla planifolia TaxID=51239 RepID=A0A835VJP3_VANPL|nr:hypothetical protein HPP92_004199 [Vanilla planifolia]